MSEIFAALLLGHLAGDFPLQNLAMMIGKSKNGFEGHLWCTLHCLFYTAAVCIILYWFAGIASATVALAVFASHWPVDRWSLADKWMAAIRSRRPGITYYEEKIDAAFYAIVYAATDNTLHLMIMWAALKLLT